MVAGKSKHPHTTKLVHIAHAHSHTRCVPEYNPLNEEEFMELMENSSVVGVLRIWCGGKSSHAVVRQRSRAVSRRHRSHQLRRHALSPTCSRYRYLLWLIELAR